MWNQSPRLLDAGTLRCVEPGGTTIRPPRPGKLGVYSPTYLGKKYEVLRRGRSDDPKFHYTELGWRSGHLKKVHFGTRWSQEKVRWIDPYIAFMRTPKILEDRKDVR